MKKMEIIIADEGMYLTNGKTHGSWHKLAEGESADNFREITKEEYEEILRIEENEQTEV